MEGVNVTACVDAASRARGLRHQALRETRKQWRAEQQDGVALCLVHAWWGSEVRKAGTAAGSCNTHLFVYGAERFMLACLRKLQRIVAG